MRRFVLALPLLALTACGTTPLTTDDGGTTTDAGIDAGSTAPIDAGVPINVPAETWSWVEFPDSACGNGAPTGIGVNLTGRSQDILIYLEGGGACWNALTCYTVASAINISTGYNQASFSTENIIKAPLFSRTDATNPFRDATYVFVPYCTGDLHSGDAVQTYDGSQPTKQTFHKGARNLEAFLHRLTATLPGAQRVWLSGSSAGGYGAQIQYHRVAAAWPQAQVHVLADGAQVIQPAGTLWHDMAVAWNLQAPPGCAACGTDFTALNDYNFTTWPTRRFALLAADQDKTLRTYFNYTATDFAAATNAMLAAKYDPRANAKYFELQNSQQHTMLGSYTTLVHPTTGVSLKTWIGWWATGDAAWVNQK